jgi:hypothetical protein
MVLLSGCAHEVIAHDNGEDAYRGEIIGTVAIIEVRAKTFRASIASMEIRTIHLEAEDGDQITCSLAPYQGLGGWAGGPCMWGGKQVFNVGASQGPPPSIHLYPTESRPRVYGGTFNTLTRQMSLTIDDEKYTGKIIGRLEGGAQGVLHSSGGRQLKCSLVDAAGYGRGSCSINKHHRLSLFWKQGGFHI